MKLGRDVVYDYLRDLGVRCLFGVPGTNEIPLIDGTSLASNDVAYVPCLHENIALGAAMGYARASGKPGVVELHVTPGAAHGIGNLFNAYKSHVPVVVLCAQQHSELLLQEPLLASDLVQVARQYTKWSHEVRFPDELPLVLQRAFKEALAPPMRPVFVSIPWDFTLASVQDGPPRVTRVAPHFVGDRDAVSQAAERLAAATSPIIVAGDGVGAAEAWPELARLAKLLGAPVYSESLSSYMNFPNRLPAWQGELPTSQALMQQVFQGHDVAFLCGYNAQAQVLVFKYALGPMIPADVAKVFLHDDEWEIGKNDYGEVAILGDIKATLPILCDGIEQHPGRDAAAAAAREEELGRLDEQRQEQLDAFAAAVTEREASAPVTGENVAIALAKLQPQMKAPLILSNEAISDSAWFQKFLAYDEPASYFCAQGGSLGYSMPASLGLKLGAGADRTVVNVVGDGSALFYPHTWWTTRKFDLPILYVITNNREYKTLLLGLELVEKIYDWKPSGDPWYLHLEKPPMSFVGLAAPFGIDGTLVSQLGELEAGLQKGLAAVEGGQPYVVEVLTDPSLQPPKPPPRLDALLASKEENGERDRRFDHLGPA
jgi:benzoylformate decarboxylase